MNINNEQIEIKQNASSSSFIKNNWISEKECESSDSNTDEDLNVSTVLINAFIKAIN